MAYIIWIFLIGLIIWSYYDPKLPKWVPLVLYLITVFVRVREKWGNYRDWKKINKRDEKIKLEETAEDFAQRGLVFSGIRIKSEAKVKEDFDYERKQERRKFLVKLVDSLLLK